MFKEKKFLLVAACIILTAAFFRFVNINTEEVLSDEGNYALRGAGWNDFMQSSTLTTPWNWYEKEKRLPAWTQLSFNDHPPLHFAFIWLSSHIFGIHLWSARLPSVLFGILSVALLMAIFKRYNFIFGAISSGLFLALLPWHIYISRRAIQESMVIFFLLLTLYVVIRLSENEKNEVPRVYTSFIRHFFVGTKSAEAEENRPRSSISLRPWSSAKADKIILWICLGCALGLGMISKYSFAIILPLIIFFIIYKKWHKNKNFYATAVIFFIITSPVIIYNIFMFLERRHFDLQISRFLKMDTKMDWFASVQGLWQGNISSITAYFQNVISWISILAAIIIIIGLTYIIWRRMREYFTLAYISLGMVIITGVFAAITLGDSGRSSIIIPFIALGFGISSEALLQNKKNISLIAISLSLGMLTFGAISDRIGISLLPKAVMASFYEKPVGFYYYEKWKNENFSQKYQPTHYSSLYSWFLHFKNILKDPAQPIIIYDMRIIWFGANWYFYKDSFYSQNIPFLHSGIAELLLKGNAIQLDGRKVFFVEADTASMDARPYFDPVSRSLYIKIMKMSKVQNIMPIIITNQFGENVVKIWEITWNSENL